jgi:hypothetical protein
MDAAFDCVQRDGEVGWVGREDRNGGSLGQGIDGGLICIGIGLVVGGE